MAENLLRALAQVRGRLLDPEALVRAVASGRQKAGSAAVAPGRAALRRPQGRPAPPGHGVRRDAGAHQQPRRRATGAGRRRRPARRAVRQLARRDDHRDRAAAGDPQGRGAGAHAARGPRRPRSTAGTTATRSGCCRRTTRCSGRSGWRTPRAGSSRAGSDKYRQVEEFLRLLDAAVTEAIDKGQLRRPTAEEPLRVVDLGCGNAYLTFAAERFLAGVRGLPVRLVGVDVKEQSREHNEKVAGELGLDATFVVGTHRRRRRSTGRPEVVLALHACDTATDEALARAVEWEAALVLAAPCCHHDVAAQLRKAPTPAPYAMLTRHGILRERLADTLTDALRATLMRLQGYRVDVVQFVESKHTPRNTLLRATRTGAPVKGGSLRARVRRAGRGLGHPPEAGRAARWLTWLSGSWPGCSSFRSCSARPWRRRTRRRWCSPSRTTRSSSPAASRSSTAWSSRPTTRATPAGSSRSTRHGRDGRHHRLGRRPDRRRGARTGRRRRGLGRRHRRQHRVARLRPGRPRRRRSAATPSRTSYDAHLPRRRPRRRDADAATPRPAASTSPRRAPSAATLYAAPESGPTARTG